MTHLTSSSCCIGTKATRITARLVAANVPQNDPVNERGRRISIWDPLNAKVIIVDLVRS